MTASTVSVGIRRLANVRRRLVVLGNVTRGAGVVNIGWAVMTRTVGVIAEDFDHTYSFYWPQWPARVYALIIFINFGII